MMITEGINTGKYRPEIDGLRTIAIVPVVLFHAGVPGLSGGFVGVDIFFVISGFLITELLVSELDATGRISIAAFYARRVRRLLPALFVVIAATLLLGSIFLPVTGELQSLARSTLAVLFFVSNIFFWRTQTGYFAEAAESLPLLHTWTLAVEEQFYIFWPFVIVVVSLAAARFGLRRNRALILIIAVAGLISFGLCYWLSFANPTMAFFLVNARAWEFAIGGLLALALRCGVVASRACGCIAAAVGLIAIGISITLLNSDTPWPATAALLPTLGSAAVIFGTAIAPKSASVTLLSIAPMTFIGRLSYSWYLWHWPLLSILHGEMLGEETTIQRAVAVIVSLIASIASYYLVEVPIRFRRPGAFATTSGTLLAGVAMLIAGTTGSLIVMSSAQRELTNSPYLTAISRAQTEGFDWPGYCNHPQSPFSGLAPVQQCRLGDNSSSTAIVVWGDSHALALLPMLDLLGKRNNYVVIPRTRGGCRPFDGPLSTVGIKRTEVEVRNCARFNSAVISQLAELNKAGATTIIIASRWPPGGESGIVATKDWAGQLQSSVDAAQAAGLKVVLAADVPQFLHPVPDCLARLPEAACEASRESIDRVRRPALAVLNSIASANGDLKIWDPINRLCDQRQCWVSTDDRVILYRDSHHLSVAGALWLAKQDAALVTDMIRKCRGGCS
jgi:peptidoglycan/LPS O-acetylase OafA/YrhL